MIFAVVVHSYHAYRKQNYTSAHDFPLKKKKKKKKKRFLNLCSHFPTEKHILQSTFTSGPLNEKINCIPLSTLKGIFIFCV